MVTVPPDPNAQPAKAERKHEAGDYTRLCRQH
jgi:hypothetical protein